MGIISGVIGAGAKAAGAIVGGIATAKANRKIAANIEQQKQANEDWYNRNYNADATQRGDAQRLLTMTEQSILKRNKAAEAQAAVMGTSPEAVAAEKAANNQALADAASQINATADARKDAIEQQYIERNDGFIQQQNQLAAKKAEAVANAAQQLGDAGSSIASIIPV